MNLQPLLDPRSIAVVGASQDPTRIGGRPIGYLKREFAGPIYPINPKREEIQGLKCYARLADLPGPVDLVLLCVPADVVLEELQRASDAGAKAAVIFAAGFAESGDEQSVQREAELAAIARRTGMLVLGPNTTGMANVATGAMGTFATPFRDALPRPARGIAVMGQSGATCNAMAYNAMRQGVALRYFIATGNETCLGMADIAGYLAQDTALDAVVAYMEGSRDGAQFLQAARRLSDQGVPFIVLKVGNSEKGREASASHTAALAGDAAVSRAALASANVIQAHDLGHLDDLAYLSCFRGRTWGPRVAVVTASGAAGVMTADGLDGRGMTLPDFSPALQAKLRERIPVFGMVTNPVDVTANLLTDGELLGHAMGALAHSDEVDMIVLALAGHMVAKLTGQVVEAAARTNKMILVIDPDGTIARDHLVSCGIPVFHRFREGLAALESFNQWHAGRARGQAAVLAAPLAAQAAAVARETVEAVRRSGRSHLTEAEGMALLRAGGVPVPRAAVMRQGADAAQAAADTGLPAVLKILSPDIQHKSDVGGVRLNLGSAEALQGAFDEVIARVSAAVPSARLEGAIVQQMAPRGVEVLVGIRRDATFGQVMTIGMGGVQAELLADVQTLLLPVDEAAALAALQRLRLFPLLDGYRGTPRCDVPAAAQAIARLSALAMALADQVDELEVNPISVGPQGQGALALDCLVSLRR